MNDAAPGTPLAELELSPLEAEPTTSIIARRIRDAIASGALPPGTRLTEMHLARQLQVSRGPLREALQRLVQEGLLKNRRNQGVAVISLSSEDVADVYLARMACERTAALRILGSGASDWSKRLRSALDRLEAAAATGDWEATMWADLAFHEQLVESSGSARLLRMFRTLMVETALCVRALQSRYKDAGELVAEHQVLFQELEGGQPDALMRVIEEHMRDAAERLGGSL
ncbi:MAG: GntR family transcriptional regulator [Actinomycetota bacterium]|nr:GntR family transcriptional regulator [Actinomycetota bacterium]